MNPTILTAGDLDLLPLFTSLKADGATLVPSLSGRQCLGQLRTFTPDAIVIDERLPDCRGTDICSRIKRVARLRNVPLIMIVPQQNSDRLATEATLVGADAVLVRPVTSAQLREKVVQLLYAVVPPDASLEQRPSIPG